MSDKSPAGNGLGHKSMDKGFEETKPILSRRAARWPCGASVLARLNGVGERGCSPREETPHGVTTNVQNEPNLAPPAGG
jgi:hypothetical protein